LERDKAAVANSTVRRELMKRFNQYCAALLLAFVLAGSALAGDISCGVTGEIPNGVTGEMQNGVAGNIPNNVTATGYIPYGVVGEIPYGVASSSQQPTITEILITLITGLLP
jgi:hypothetical protein